MSNNIFTDMIQRIKEKQTIRKIDNLKNKTYKSVADMFNARVKLEQLDPGITMRYPIEWYMDKETCAKCKKVPFLECYKCYNAINGKAYYRRVEFNSSAFNNFMETKPSSKVLFENMFNVLATCDVKTIKKMSKRYLVIMEIWKNNRLKAIEAEYQKTHDYKLKEDMTDYDMETYKKFVTNIKILQNSAQKFLTVEKEQTK